MLHVYCTGTYGTNITKTLLNGERRRGQREALTEKCVACKYLALALYVLAERVLPAQTQLALHHEPVLLAEPAVAVDDLLALHAHQLDTLAVYTKQFI